MNFLVCFGTRPEAVKMAPICAQLRQKEMSFKICVTAQHREMLDQVLDFFGLKPDYDLDLMEGGQSLNGLTSRIFSEVDKVFNDFLPDVVLVQGDTTTAFAIGMAAFYRQIKVAHVEAGLRTYNKSFPFPEEANRQVISRIADFHFAPTQKAAQNLRDEKIPEDNISITGNTVVDALELAASKMQAYREKEIDDLKRKLDPSKKMLLVTGHRRENFGEGLENICEALTELARNDEVQVVYPVHLNPNIKIPVMEMLDNRPNIILTEPVGYPVFIWLMKKAAIIISDSGGIQEEAPSFHTPVLVTREFTERMEGVEVGFSFLVGSNKALIIEETRKLLKNPPDYENILNPYGDGKAAERIVDFLSSK